MLAYLGAGTGFATGWVKPMTAFELIGLVLAVGLVVYLVIALLYPERFQ